MTVPSSAPSADGARDRGSSRRRMTAGVVLAVSIAAGLVVHGLLPDTHSTDIAGDALYALAVYAVIALLAPRWPALGVGGAALAWCVGVELFQLTGVPVVVADAFPPAALILGTVFDPRDLLVYASAVAGATALDVAVTRLARAART